MIDTATNAVVATVTMGNGPAGVAVTPDGTRVYVTNFDDATVSVIETSTDTVVATVTVGDGPFAFGLFIGPSSRAVPTLSAWALLGLALALVALGGWRLAGRRRAGPAASR